MAIPISNVTRRQVYAPSGSGGAGPYAFTFEILANTDIAVFKDNTLLTLTTHYTVTIAANGTGSVTITAAGLALAPVSPTQYAIVGNRTIARSTDFTTGGDFFANTINDELDQQTIFAQQNAEGLNRALQAPQTDPTTINMTLPAKATRASKTLTFDSDGNPSAGVSAADVANAVTYATNAANSATAAASSASSASSSASAASGSASTASTQASNASTSASNASTSASNASTSATNAAASASTATTQASNASTSATNAASSASAASTSASNAATSATNASNSATTASTQASNAATSATAASGSATSAASSAAAAASALDSFDDRYLGTKTSDPTLDNDGNALAAGALYFSTTQNVMKVYDGASWITATSAGATSLLRFRYVATSGQTTFSGADAASATLTYTVNNIAVHRNGVTLDTSEYTASNGTSIVLTVAAGTGDIVDIIAFKSFTVADALSAVSGGTVNGAVTVTGVTTVQAGTAAAPAITTTGDTNTGIYFPAADTIAFSEGGVESMRIDASGNMGLGVTPSASTTAGTIYFPSNTTFGRYGYTQNSYFNGTNYIYSSSSQASLYQASSGSHVWYNAASGTAGNTISFTQAMTLDASGNLLVGTTTAYNSITVKANASANALAIVGRSSDDIGFLNFYRTNGTLTASIGANPTALEFDVNGSERARFNSDGNFGVGDNSIPANALICTTTNTASLRTSRFALNPSDGNFTIGFRNGVVGSTSGTEIGRLSAQYTGSDMGWISFTRGAGADLALIRVTNTSAGVSLAVGGTSWGSLSDERSKTNLVAIDNALAKVATLRAVTGRYIEDSDDKRRVFLIAQDVLAVLPEAVSVQDDEEGTLLLQYTEVIPLLVAAIKEQQAIITQLQADVAALKGTA